MFYYFRLREPSSLHFNREISGDSLRLPRLLWWNTLLQPLPWETHQCSGLHVRISSPPPAWKGREEPKGRRPPRGLETQCVSCFPLLNGRIYYHRSIGIIHFLLFRRLDFRRIIVLLFRIIFNNWLWWLRYYSETFIPKFTVVQVWKFFIHSFRLLLYLFTF